MNEKSTLLVSESGGSQTDPDYLTTEELAAKMRIAKQTLRHWRMKREGPPWVRFGRRVLYPRDGFATWAAAQVVAS